MSHVKEHKSLMLKSSFPPTRGLIIGSTRSLKLLLAKQSSSGRSSNQGKTEKLLRQFLPTLTATTYPVRVQ